ncbi:MAG TPA: OpgC domain-containing protein [Casimicrobiaceae bacterium]|nr:OpgC domain-containing protein [Casimicrobiaceae bacterium]
MERQTELDWLRGLMLVLMTVTHLPTWFSQQLGQPFGFVSAAEGFVFLSAYLVGAVYARRARTRGYDAMRRSLWGRALKVYAAHVGLLLFLLLLLVPIAISHDAHAITDLASFYMERPHLALASGVVLGYNPPLLDILPMYVVFLAASPLVLAHGMRRGFGTLFAVSAVVWLFAQYDGGRHVYESVATLVGWPIPYSATGAFSFMAWQLLWLVGLRVGAAQSAPETLPAPTDSDRWGRVAFWFAVGLASVFFVWRHAVGQTFGTAELLNTLFDKWHLGPLRLLNFAALALIIVRMRPILIRLAEHSAVATLGRASLVVFGAHLVICLTALAIVGEATHAYLHLTDVVLLSGTLAALWGIARASIDAPQAFRSAGRTVAARLGLRF